jgi:RNA polymerase sigma factor (sigma-70 family)
MPDVISSSARLAIHITALAAGNRDALKQIYDESSGRLFAICLRITGDSDAAQDVLQEVYVKLLTRSSAYDPDQGAAMGWLMQIARNASIDWVRARGRQARTRDGLTIEPRMSEPLIDDQLADKQDGDRAIASLASLDGDTRRHVRDAFLGGYSYPEIAERDGLPLATVKSRIRRGLIQMRKAMTDD